MSLETVLDNEFVSVWYHPLEKVVHHKIKKYMPAEHFRAFLTKGADAFEKYRCQKWLSDDRANAVVPQGIADFGEKVWTPRMVKAGFKWWAIIMPDMATGKLSMRAFIDAYRKVGVTVEIFGDEQSALTWLRNAK